MTISSPPALKKRRFRYTASSAGWAMVECLNCEWKRKHCMPDSPLVFRLAGTHNCPGVETLEQAMDRRARDAFAGAFTARQQQEAGRP